MRTTRTLSVVLPSELHRAAKRVAERLHCSIGQLVRDALADRVETIAAKWQPPPPCASTRELEDAPPTYRPRGPGESPLRPSPPSAPGSPHRSHVTRRDLERQLEEEHAAPITPLYAKHARVIADIIESGSHGQLHGAMLAAVAEIRRDQPLGAPPDGVIISRLERMAVKMPSARVESVRHDDGLVGRVVDTTTMRTFGDVFDDEEEP